ncbi:MULTISPECIES: cysteine--tRNA ligase [Methanobacterium]|jgi:cysteinyl-tRNA synthetase|uniref:Cysteine--tRNA ligase n=1 Tax=Methanobacterium veterum TaxID=408577 RepID=A0A9E4ZVX9_9EURY|nr:MULTISPECIES: cysteine--tRNA ligase [Methanobacterium]MCZ3365091.1 cysteine--tRNA ligase [Methanobacterium veterum]MCZ3372846.1 cysteine--tRNA ligase [Methanobacterium veterum]
MKVYNTMTRKKEELRPMNKNRIKMFVCGPTVYDESHIGHGRTYIAFDVIARYLKYKGYSVFYLENITDIDDKIIKRASELGVEPLELAKKYESLYFKDMELLGVTNVNYYARAMEHLTEIINQIQTLVDKGFAYETSTGVYFDESKLEDFGKLSNRNIEDLNIHRVNLDSTKRNPGDFALWKKRDEKPSWDSPWGKGRPGWHIEDTAITETYFGGQFDIHGGGLDLIFPHHEAEIAQMESATGKKPMVKYWMHTGFLNVSGEKMSKSLGNFVTIEELLKEYDPQVFRYFVLSTHYRSPIDFSDDALMQSQNSLKRIHKVMKTVDELLESNITNENRHDEKYLQLLEDTKEEFLDAMDNDFNTPIALSALFNLVRDINKGINEEEISKKVFKEIKNLLNEFGDILGLTFSVESVKSDSDELVNILIDVREELRKKKDYELSDKIRSQLRDAGIDLEDK